MEITCVLWPLKIGAKNFSNQKKRKVSGWKFSQAKQRFQRFTSYTHTVRLFSLVHHVHFWNLHSARFRDPNRDGWTFSMKKMGRKKTGWLDFFLEHPERIGKICWNSRAFGCKWVEIPKQKNPLASKSLFLGPHLQFSHFCGGFVSEKLKTICLRFKHLRSFQCWSMI